MGIVVIVFLVILGLLVFIFDIYYLICKLNFYEDIYTGDQDKISKNSWVLYVKDDYSKL